MDDSKIIMPFETLRWDGGIDGSLVLLDQRKLPGAVENVVCRGVEETAEAIRTLAVRGAPAIGVTAAYGLCLGAQEVGCDEPLEKGLEQLQTDMVTLGRSRPTAVNLFWAMQRMARCAQQCVQEHPGGIAGILRECLLAEAHAICAEDKQMCEAIGRHGEPLIVEDGAVLTHCNAGALATAGIGTALAPLYTAHQKGKRFTVYADETRPVLQGARLTAWELGRSGIQTILICDNMAASLMKAGRIDMVITGADRIAANGDTANKIGTLGLSILAREYGIPFYIAAPSSTFDLSIAEGRQIPIEQRPGEEVRGFGEAKVAPEEAAVYNPAFDVTDAANITAIITERGVLRPPLEKSIKEQLEPK